MNNEQTKENPVLRFFFSPSSFQTNSNIEVNGVDFSGRLPDIDALQVRVEPTSMFLGRALCTDAGG